MVDWNLAVATATRLVRPGPEVSRDEARAVVAELRRHAKTSEEHVRAFTRLGTEEGHDTPVLVVDRPGWIRANVAGFREILRPLLDKMQERRGNTPGGSVMSAVGGKVTGVELGMLLSFLSSRVLGQYETFAPATRELPSGGNGGGRLLLVAPNIVHVERELDVDPHDFRLWVCLHEETHRVQFTAVPWMRDHIRSEIEALVSEIEVDPAKLASMVGEGVKRVGDILRGDDDVSLLDLFSSARQREVLDRITAVMSLLEGHADVVMDGVGPEVIPTVKDIRRRFTERRKGTSYLDRVLRKLLGLDAKMAQYRDGAAFTRGVLDQVGMDGFNAVWAEPAHLPSRVEISDPAAWVRRVHG